MKKNIFDKLSNWYNNYRKEQEEIKKIPRDFWIDLDSGDYQKYKDSIPRYGSLVSIGVLLLWVKIWLFGFLFYVICDFMDYIIIQKYLIDVGLIMVNVNGFLFNCMLIILSMEIVLILIVSDKKEKHRLKFYKRVKKK